MRLEATITSIIDDCDQLSISIRGWSESDPEGTYPRPLGTINIPNSNRTCEAYYVGRRVFIYVRPS